MEGYDVDNVENVSSDFFCVICLKLMCNPVQFKCGHGMCSCCYKRLINRSNNRSRQIQCPQCREIVREDEIFSNMMMHRLILAVIVHCPDEFCAWQGELITLHEHEETSHAGKDKKDKKAKQPNQHNSKSVSKEKVMNHNEALQQFSTKIASVEKKLILRLMSVEKNQQLAQENTQCLETSVRCAMHYNKTVICFLFIILSIAMGHWYRAEFMLSTKKYFRAVESNFKNFERIVFQSSSSNNKTTTYNAEFNYISEMISSLTSITLDNMDSSIKEFKQEFDQLRSSQLETADNMKIAYNVQLDHLRVKNLHQLGQVEWTHSIKVLLVEIKQFKAEIFNSVLTLENKLLISNLQKCVSLMHRVRRLLSQVNIFRMKRKYKNSIKSQRIHLELADIEDRLLESHSLFNEGQNEETLKKLLHELQWYVINKTNDYYSNFTGVVAYKSDFSKHSKELYNIYDLDLIFVWKVNISLINTIKDNHALYSENFAIASDSKSFLLLYKDKSREGMWEVTYNQERNATVLDAYNLSIMNQLREEQLLCPESTVGDAPKDKIATVTKFFSIPLSKEEMVSKGYILNDIMFIKCTID